MALKKYTTVIGFMVLGILIFGLYKFSNSTSLQAKINFPTPTPSPYFLKSSVFKNNTQAQQILQGQTLDVSNPALYNNTNAVYMASLPYRIFLSLHMLGYQNNTSSIKSANVVVSLLSKFQQKNNLPVTPVFDINALKKLDSFLYDKELTIKDYSKKSGSIFVSLPAASSQTAIPKDYIGWIFNYPLEVLPTHLTQNLTPSNYFLCIIYQCNGSIQKWDGSVYGSPSDPQAYDQGNFLFIPDIFPVSADGNSIEIQKSLYLAHVILHEYAHYLDNSLYITNSDLNRGIINTSEFYKISFKLNQDPSTSCLERKTNDVKEFITRYGYNGSNSLPCTDFGSNYGAPHEDFAESFTEYVMAGNIFREAAKQNPVLKQKYYWLKTNVFANVEYNTSLPDGGSYAYSGCSDSDDSDPAGGPFYISCNDDFVWDGKISSFLMFF